VSLPCHGLAIDLQNSLYWLRLIQLLLAIPLLAIAGQGFVHVLTRAVGQDPKANFFYRLLEVIGSPVTRLARYITPKFIADRHLPLVALSLLAVGYVWTMIAIANLCLGAGVPVAQCLQGN
jgi:hypothetical protein